MVSLKGLSSEEAKQRLVNTGPNSMPDASVHALEIALKKFWAPVPWMLEIVIIIELVLHDFVEATVITILLVFNAALGFFQEGRAQATLNVLKSKLALTASVLRDGHWKNTPAANLVPGDLVKLSLGGIVAADVKILEGSVLIDQSMITGESIPVEGGAGYQTFAGALIRRGEAIAEVTATGIKTKFGRTAELIRTAHVESTQQKVVFRVVKNLALFNSVIIILLVTYALIYAMPLKEIVPLILTAVLMSIPVALPATFTLAAAIGAQALGKIGVLPTRLSAVDEAATMDTLCVDKTGTLTQNELSVTEVKALKGFEEAQILGLAAIASSEGGQDSVDAAIRVASAAKAYDHLPKLNQFTPFDPATKMSQAIAIDQDGKSIHIIKGAFTVVSKIAKQETNNASILAEGLEKKGYRVLALAFGPSENIRLAGLIALSDPPRSDSLDLVKQLDTLGVRTIMITGDAPATAEIVARQVGLNGPVCIASELSNEKIRKSLKPETFAVFAGVLPEDKFNLVKIFQKAGNTIGMCGDGANDAPALRQVQMGIAVSTATDVAKSAAGIILTQAGLSGIVAAIKEGRIIFQRVLTYTLKSVTHKFMGALFLLAGIIITGHAVLTPLLLVISMITGDFLSMVSATDNVRMSPTVNTWRVGNLTIAGVILGSFDLLFCISILAIGKYRWGFDIDSLRTLSIVTLIYSGQATLYMVRERRHFWNSRPSIPLMISSLIDLVIISTLATKGILMTSLPLYAIGITLVATIIFGFLLDLFKVIIFRRLQIA